MKSIIDELRITGTVCDEKLKTLIEDNSETDYLFESAEKVRINNYGKKVFIRGLIEFTSFCKNNCYYCGIRCGNKNAQRYRLDIDAVLNCCDKGYSLGFRTFVLQGGEDPYYTDDKICGMISRIKNSHPDCAVTLSIGEKSRESYEKFFNAGASRYLLRHETADSKHYAELHPSSLSSENRKRCLFDLKETGFQTGSGFMVGSPYQTTENLIADLRFLQTLQPDMIGIGPFIPHKDTPFGGFNGGGVLLTLKMISILRLMFPYALIPSTTALGTVHKYGRELGILAGANVVMPNLSPEDVKGKYSLYNNKLVTGSESADGLNELKNRISAIGYKIVIDKGDVIKNIANPNIV